MRVRDVMSRPVVSVGPGTSLREAWELARSHGFRHLPVLEGDRLVGILSDRDLRDAAPSSLESRPDTAAFDRTPVRYVMMTPVETVGPEEPVEEAAALMLARKVSALPVVNDAGELVGIVTTSDLLRHLAELTGVLAAGSSRVAVRLRHDPAALARLGQALERAGRCALSMLSQPEGDGCRLILRLEGIDPRPAVRELRDAGFEVEWPEA
ncbi:MAG: CBS and ACT domain-containing protein [Bacillota bacterium]|nr:CBS and ACT domain-containing protein [Bacillota bacterium]